MKLMNKKKFKKDTKNINSEIINNTILNFKKLITKYTKSLKCSFSNNITKSKCYN